MSKYMPKRILRWYPSHVLGPARADGRGWYQPWDQSAKRRSLFAQFLKLIGAK